MGRPTAEALAALAPRAQAQFGVVTSAQAAEAGVDRHVVARLARDGLLIRRYRGVYALATGPPSWEQAAMAAQFAVGGRGALSHLTAAIIHGLPGLPEGRRPVDVTVPRGRRPRGDVPRLRQCDIFDPTRHRATVGPFVVTTVPWTLVALGADLLPYRTQRIYDAAVAEGRITVDEIDDLLFRWWHHPGVVNARLAVGALMPEFAGTRSQAERRFLRILEAAGLPLPRADVSVRVNGRDYVLDFLYRDTGLWIEIDAHPTHFTPLGQRADGLRQNDIVALRLTPLRFTGDDLLRAPMRVARQVKRALEAAGPPDQGVRSVAPRTERTP